MGGGSKFGLLLAVVFGVVAVLKIKGSSSSFDKEVVVEFFRHMSHRLGNWAIPVYVAIHTISLSLCLPYAVFFEAGASLLFGFFPALLCVFSAKVLGASLSFWIGRLLFRSSGSAMGWARSNKYFNVLLRGVERDGWKFVLLARFSPIPSYVINYGLAATKVAFLRDFLAPTVVGCVPMILQNTSIGSLAGAAVGGSQPDKSKVWSYVFPMMGISSSILISLRIKKYSSILSLDDKPEEKTR
ncbi:uncharacterized protein LOC112527971 [Cynara cardunculus var. scolymus]|uniref:SNARE associated Golgi protein n=1 Tax=Cynara cardunculus var. scolymus TaxID=59895 RepID=A0A103XS04_CYNCS|nr:uncharacterized protein LOC112527971 [Cynara cardunculus var. scolymus]KVH95744.1 SNARE associated Golgi protein [Cynara cardunculus var. scolymus]